MVGEDMSKVLWTPMVHSPPTTRQMGLGAVVGRRESDLTLTIPDLCPGGGVSVLPSFELCSETSVTQTRLGAATSIPRVAESWPRPVRCLHVQVAKLRLGEGEGPCLGGHSEAKMPAAPKRPPPPLQWSSSPASTRFPLVLSLSLSARRYLSSLCLLFHLCPNSGTCVQIGDTSERCAQCLQGSLAHRSCSRNIRQAHAVVAKMELGLLSPGSQAGHFPSWAVSAAQGSPGRWRRAWEFAGVPNGQGHGSC